MSFDNTLAYEYRHLMHVARIHRPVGTDRPERLIDDKDAGKRRGGNISETDAKLFSHDLKLLAAFGADGLSDAQDRRHFLCKRRDNLLPRVVVRLSLGTSLGVPDQHEPSTRVFCLPDREFSRMRAARFGMCALNGKCDFRSAIPARELAQKNRGRRDDERSTRGALRDRPPVFKKI